MRLDYRYYLTEDRKRLVRESDPAAHSLLYPAGTEITQADADKWGLHKPSVKAPEATKVIKPKTKEGA